MTEDEIMRILEEMKSQIRELSSKVNRISRKIGMDPKVKVIEQQKNEYCETEIPDVDELDRRNMKKKEKWVKEIY